MNIEKKIPLSLKVVLIFSYLSNFLLIGFFAPFLMYLLFRRHFFVRYHSFCAICLHLFAWLVSLPFRISSHFFVIELEKNFITIEGFLAGLFSSEAWFTLFLIVLGSGMFMFSVFVLHVLFLKSGNKDRLKYKPFESYFVLMIISVIVPLVFYTEGLWIAGENFAHSSWFQLNLNLFQDPYKLIPGHIVLLWCGFLSWLVIKGRVFYFAPITALFIKLHTASKLTGNKRYRSARLRSFIFPGWGDLYDQKWVSGIATVCCLLLGLMFFWISLGLNYSILVEDISGLNANFTWYFLSQLGLRSHILTDKQFLKLFGNPFVLGFLSFYILTCYLYAWLSIRNRYRKTEKAKSFGIYGFLQIVSSGILLHLIPVSVLILIPISVRPIPLIVESLNQQKQAEQKREKEPVMVIPDYYENINIPDDSGLFQGNDGENTNSNKSRIARNKTNSNQSPQKQHLGLADQKVASSEKSRIEKVDQNSVESLESTEKKTSSKKGQRKKKNYSSYLSIRIRNIEKNLQYWNKQPRPYSAVFEYRISRTGRVYDVRLLEGSGFNKADQKTIKLIEAMDPVLPPPEQTTVLVRELFWNTEPADKNLPTPLKRKLSTLFDGRLLEPL